MRLRLLALPEIVLWDLRFRRYWRYGTTHTKTTLEYTRECEAYGATAYSVEQDDCVSEHGQWIWKRVEKLSGGGGGGGDGFLHSFGSGFVFGVV
ncbi:uncharacterized protein STEHIDRAFT_120998 [Stereum hirsutum FP-91666 SS1]|uniref:uncharacterized protein n=1 Tax=Stereum hirsutum (strain FP-91666) TaxID=721885 RepID=UPI000440F0BB|nr:uncharacterized protein STEHIDRAFT_120998 [Stereum hirsutum FP-91666 SS1]EIM87353.1 hypothetical protein STEHIDRAFT_120998 [Stereum hirsutum FP-91666 SS1]